MGQIGWGDVKTAKEGVSGSSSSQDLYLKIGVKNKIRLVGKPHEVNIAWMNGKKYVVPENYVSRLENLGIKCRTNYAINIFDREDTANGVTRVKVLEKGTKIFSAFKAYFEEFKDDNGKNIDPGGVDGPDWIIKATIPAGKDKRNTEYQVMPLGKVPFNAKEIELIRRCKLSDEEKKNFPLNERGPIDLAKLYDLDKASKVLDEVLSNSTSIKAGVDGDDLDGMEGTTSIEDIVSAAPKQTSTPTAKSADSEEDLDKMLQDAF